MDKVEEEEDEWENERINELIREYIAGSKKLRLKPDSKKLNEELKKRADWFRRKEVNLGSIFEKEYFIYDPDRDEDNEMGYLDNEIIDSKTNLPYSVFLDPTLFRAKYPEDIRVFFDQKLVYYKFESGLPYIEILKKG